MYYYSIYIQPPFSLRRLTSRLLKVSVYIFPKSEAFEVCLQSQVTVKIVVVVEFGNPLDQKCGVKCVGVELNGVRHGIWNMRFGIGRWRWWEYGLEEQWLYRIQFDGSDQDQGFAKWKVWQGGSEIFEGDQRKFECNRQLAKLLC